MPVVYDIETYPNLFTLAAVGLETDDKVIFEVSERRNDLNYLLQWLQTLHQQRIEMIGFNNIHFDYCLIHLMFELSDYSGFVTAMYEKAVSIINAVNRFDHMIWANNRYIPQIDLFKIHHFDNPAKSTSLKALQFNMRSDTVEDLPFPPGSIITREQIPIVCSYNMHDSTETKKFALESINEINFRREITTRYQHDFMNHNDTKIGKDYFIMRLEQANPGCCYTGRPRKPIQTHRDFIRVSDIILPFVTFETNEFTRILEYFKSQVITETKSVFKDLHCEINGFHFQFGTGGIHGSVSNEHVTVPADRSIIDIDVTSFYPNIAIQHGFYPQHLGKIFCDIYQDVMNERRKYPDKNAPENKMLKLALNGVYGDSNNVYSPFYDPQYTMSITINGQLLLCMLAEKLIKIPDIQIFQINTDGLTIGCPNALKTYIQEVCEWWETITRLQLEFCEYDYMYIRDVNNYIARDVDGKVKRKGAYESLPPGDRIPLGWHQDCSAMIVPKAAEAWLLDGIPVEHTILSCADKFDFMIRVKTKRDSELHHGDIKVQNTTRFYISNEGEQLVKVSPPPKGCISGNFKRAANVSKPDYHAWHNKNGNVWNPEIHTKSKSVYQERKIQVCKGWKTTICNNVNDFDWNNLNYDWYIAEAKKLY